MTLPRILSAIVGSGIGIWSLLLFFREKTHRFKALFWLAIGSTMIYAAFRPQIIELVGSDSAELRLRLIVALFSFIVLTITLEAIRVARMQERYAFLWLATGLFLLFGSLFKDLIHFVTNLTGISYGFVVALVLFTFVLLLLFYLSVALSSLQFKLFQVSRQLALTEERLRQLEVSKPNHRAQEDTT